MSFEFTENQSLDLRCRDARNGAGPGRLSLEPRVADIVAIPDPAFLRVGRCHAVAEIVIEAAGEKGRRGLCPEPAGDRALRQPSLDRLEEVAREDRLMIADMDLAPIGDLADVESAAQEMVESTDSETVRRRWSGRWRGCAAWSRCPGGRVRQQGAGPSPVPDTSGRSFEPSRPRREGMISFLSTLA